jgi:polysaccharide pyruvyl transferase WcaK-like protein
VQPLQGAYEVAAFAIEPGPEDEDASKQRDGEQMSSEAADAQEGLANRSGPRILIFGAYANGNIGDQFQANSVAHHIQRLCPDAQVFATSNSSADRPYEFDADNILPHMTIHDPDAVNGFDALVIGGGGLLASVHKPLANPAWAESIKCPIMLFAVGASREVAAKCESVIRRAAVVTARDSFSLEVLREIRPEITLLNDPILMDERLDGDGPSDGRNGVCVIPRKMTEKNRGVYTSLSREMVDGDVVLSMFPATDTASGTLQAFGKPDSTIEAWKMQELVDGVDDAGYVLSERYHGCILALKRGRPTIGLVNSDTETRSKIGELYRQVGHPQLLLSYRNRPLTRSQIVEKLDSEFDGTIVREALASMRQQFETNAGQLLTALV